MSEYLYALTWLFAQQDIESCRRESLETYTGVKVKVKVNFTLEETTKTQRGVEVQLYSFLNIGVRSGEWSTPRPGRFTPGKDTVPIVQEAGWAPGPVRTGAENLFLTGILSPDRPSLYTD